MHMRMAKWVAVLLGNCAMAVMLPIANGGVTVYNPGFSVSNGVDSHVAADWTQNVLTKASRESWGSHDGDGWLMAMLGYNPGGYGECFQDVTNVTPGFIYSLSFWLGDDASWNGSNVTARLLWLDHNGRTIASVTTNLDAVTGHSYDWVGFALDGMAPHRATAVRVQFDAQSTLSGGLGAVKFDDLTLIEFPGLYNSGFTNGTDLDADHWTEVPSTEKAARQPWGSHDGDGYLMSLTGYNIGTSGAFYQDVRCLAPGRYTLSFWQDGDAGWNGSNVTARLIWLDGAMQAIGSVAKNLDAWTNVPWTNITLTGQSPDSAVWVRVQFDAQMPSTGSGAAKFDELRLTWVPLIGTTFSLR